jgi:uncharacterized repeat protein (TIGR01451 family)
MNVFGMHRAWSACAAASVVAFAGVFAGCESNQDVDLDDARDRHPVPEQHDATARAGSAATPGSVTIFLPGGTESSSVLRLTKTAPPEVSVGQEFDTTVEVTNLTSDTTLRDVTVVGSTDGNVEIVSSSPSASSSNGSPSWSLGSIEPGQTQSITVTQKANATGSLVECATVTYTPFACLAINVTEPALQLAKTMPVEVMACDPIPVRYVVTNTGSGPARGVEVRDELPDGLVVASSQRRVVVAPVGTLAPGESKAFEVTLEATQTGELTNRAVASGQGGLTAEDSAVVNVIKPEVSITKTAPERIFMGRTIDYDISITNDGNGPARDVVVTDTLPANVTFVSASGNGTQSGSQVVWNVGTLPVGATRDFTISVRPTAIGDYTNSVNVTGYCVEQTADTTRDAATQVQGIPAVLLEVVDAIDPVEVGTNTTYVITVTNQGSAVDRDIDLKVTLEDGAEFISGTGPTQVTGQGLNVDLAPLASLQPKQKATWQIVVKANAAGDKRFRVEMDTAQIGRPVLETEATNFYE